MNKKVKLWLIKAFEDYLSMKTLADSSEREYTTSIICFHSQQMVEKLLKAFLTYHNTQFPRTHMLEVLKQKCIELDEEFQILNFKNLPMYAVEIRYPDEFDIPSLEETNECIEIALQVKNFVLSKLNISEEEILRWIKDAQEKDKGKANS
jgi:HEPN domain-containing protein